MAGDGPNSLLIKEIDGRLNHTGGLGDPPLAAAETQELISWINQGATAPPTPPAATELMWLLPAQIRPTAILELPSNFSRHGCCLTSG